MRQRSAIELDAAKAYLIEAAVESPGTPARISIDHGDDSALCRRTPKPDVQQQLVEAMTTNETSFFRDTHPFEALRATIIPEMMQRQAGKRTLNIWSAACSTGQEAYSIAMLLRENFPALASWKVQILRHRPFGRRAGEGPRGPLLAN